jgi:hypothetical protein
MPVAASFAGVRQATIVDRAATQRLLEPWLGAGLEIDELPVPRLIVVTIDPASPPDFAAMRQALIETVPTAILDDHRTWVDRLVAMARTTVTIGLAALVLMLTATVLTVIFATRGAMAGNGHIIEVLHFVGAEARFIAAQFRRHFLFTGMQGAAAGGALAMLVFVVFSWWSSRNLATPEADQATALFGTFAIGPAGYLGRRPGRAAGGGADRHHLACHRGHLSGRSRSPPHRWRVRHHTSYPSPQFRVNSGWMKGQNTHGPDWPRRRRLRVPVRRGAVPFLLRGWPLPRHGAVCLRGGFLLFATHVGNLSTPADPRPPTPSSC